MTSMRKPSGNLKARALSSGVRGFGASVGCGIPDGDWPDETAAWKRRTGRKRVSRFIGAKD